MVLASAVMMLAFAFLPFSVLRRQHRDRSSAEWQNKWYYRLVSEMVLGLLVFYRIGRSVVGSANRYAVSRGSAWVFVGV